jgi:hypothetical protein
MGVKWAVSVAMLYPQGKDPSTHCTRDWVGFRADLDTEARGKILCPCRDQTSVAQFIVSHYTD